MYSPNSESDMEVQPILGHPLTHSVSMSSCFSSGVTLSVISDHRFYYLKPRGLRPKVSVEIEKDSDITHITSVQLTREIRR